MLAPSRTAKASNSTTYTYDPFGNLLTITDSVGNVISREYDTRGRMTAQVDPDLGRWEYAYDALGQAVWCKDAKNQEATTAYDKLGRVISRTEPDLASAWVYDSATKGVGKLASASASNGYLRTHAYDTLGRPSQVSLTIQSTSYVVGTSYDAQGRVDATTYPSGFAVKNTYTSLGFLAEIRNNATAALYWRADTVDAEGHITQQTHGNGVATTQSFDANTGRLTAVGAGPGNAVQNMSFAWDAVGNLTSRVDTTQSLTETFTYDSLNRVTSAVITGGGSKTFTYDSIGNIISKTGTGTYTYPLPGAARPHAVSSITGGLNSTFTYDANGNMLSGGGVGLTYASFNLPNQITRNNSASAFTYGPEHQRLTQVVTGGSAATTVYVDPDGKGAPFVEKEILSGGGTVQWNNYLYAGGQVVGVVFERTTSPDPTVVYTRYFHKDHLGSTAVITNEAGAVLERLSYDSWGKRRYPNGADDSQNIITSQTDRGFTGHEHLHEMRLIHMNGRIYNPLIGRFMTADPVIDGVFSTQGMNRYAYVHNNPLAYTDPNGLFLSGVRGFLKKNPVAGLVVGLATAYFLGPGGFELFAMNSWQAAVVTGSVSGLLSDGLKGAALGALSGAVTFGIGGLPLGLEGFADVAAKAVLHGVVQGTFAEMQGGKFGAAFLAAAVSKVGGYGLELAFPGTGVEAVVAKGVGVAVIGGTASVIGGGKFANGAATAAFVYAFNQLAHSVSAATAGAAIGAAVGTGIGIAASVACDVGTAGACVAANPAMVGAMGAAGAAVGAAVGELAHGNSLDSQRQTYVYQLVDQISGDVLKYGITSEANPLSRYTATEYVKYNAQMEVLASYSNRGFARAHEIVLNGSYVIQNGHFPPLTLRW